MLHRPLFPLLTLRARGEFIQNWHQAGYWVLEVNEGRWRETRLREVRELRQVPIERDDRDSDLPAFEDFTNNADRAPGDEDAAG